MSLVTSWQADHEIPSEEEESHSFSALSSFRFMEE